MPAKQEFLRLVELSPLTKDAITIARRSLRKYGAIRVKAWQLPESYRQKVFSEVS